MVRNLEISEVYHLSILGFVIGFCFCSMLFTLATESGNNCLKSETATGEREEHCLLMNPSNFRVAFHLASS